MKKIIGRITDWRREHRIRALSKQVRLLHDIGYHWHARQLLKTWTAEIKACSPSQVERMETRMGLR